MPIYGFRNLSSLSYGQNGKFASLIKYKSQELDILFGKEK